MSNHVTEAQFLIVAGVTPAAADSRTMRAARRVMVDGEPMAAAAAAEGASVNSVRNALNSRIRPRLEKIRAAGPW